MSGRRFEGVALVTGFLCGSSVGWRIGTEKLTMTLRATHVTHGNRTVSLLYISWIRGTGWERDQSTPPVGDQMSTTHSSPRCDYYRTRRDRNREHSVDDILGRLFEQNKFYTNYRNLSFWCTQPDFKYLRRILPFLTTSRRRFFVLEN